MRKIKSACLEVAGVAVTMNRGYDTFKPVALINIIKGKQIGTDPSFALSLKAIGPFPVPPRDSVQGRKSHG